MIWMVPLMAGIFLELLFANQDGLFITVLGMSLTASVVILVVLLARLALRKTPRVFSYALWVVVLFRLLCPVTISSPLSVVQPVQMASHTEGAIMDARPTSTGTAGAAVPVGGAPAYDPGPAVTFTPITVPDAPSAPVPDLPVQAGKSLPDLWSVVSAVWLGGVALLLGYSALSLLRLRRKLVGSVPLAGEKNVRLADHIPSPFVLGLVFPKIYLPSGLPESERDYILLHERTHIRRLDHVTRALAWIALSVHWFNPLVWLAFHLAGKDMEMSCDEAVLRKMGRDVRADYSTSLLRLSVGGKLPAGPLAFGGGDPQSRIKNVLSYKKPALWVVVLALVAVLCAGVALATDQNSLYIDPDSVVSVTAFDAASYTITEQNTGVYTTDDLRKDLFDPADPQVLSQEDGAELVRLINSHRKTVYGHGELTLSGREHHLKRIDCAGGDFYVLDYWYWNGFSFNPFHMGEDDYTTLVTYFDAEGNPGTTWQMEYKFDQAHCDLRNNILWSHQRNEVVDSVPADLSLSIDQPEDSVPFVRIGGTIDGITLERTSWMPPEWFAQFGPDSAALCPLGKLGFELPLCDNEVICALDAVWTDESRTAVKVTATPRAMISSYSIAGNLIFTVDLSKDGGTLLELEGHVPKLSPNAPELVPTEAEAVRVGRIAAKLLTAAEDFYMNAQSNPYVSGNLTPDYTMTDAGHVLIGGLGNAVVEWSAPDKYTQQSSLYFAHDPAFCCLPLAGKAVEGSAFWADQDNNTIEVSFNVNDNRVVSGTICGFSVGFTANLNLGTITGQDFQSLVEGETLELDVQEMLDMAHVLAKLMKGAEDYYNGAAKPSFPASSLRLGTPTYSLNETGRGVAIGGLDCPAAVWHPSLLGGTMDSRLGLPEDGELGYLAIESPRFLGGYFADIYANAIVLYYPNEPSPLLFVGVDEYTGSGVYDLGNINFTVDLASGEVKRREINGYKGQAPEISDAEMTDMARALAQLIQGAADSWGPLSNPPAEEGPLPFDQPLRLWFGSGAGAWRTIMTLHPDGSFEGTYNDSDLGVAGEGYPMGTEYICTFHGKFGDIKQASAASWTMALEELTLDTGHPVGEEWIAERTRYISRTPYGMSSEQGDGMLKPGAQFVFYTPEASGKPGGELYGMENQSSDLFEFWHWWPNRYAISGGSGGTLGCYALRNVETGYGFFDLSAWGIAPEQPGGY